MCVLVFFLKICFFCSFDGGAHLTPPSVWFVFFVDVEPALDRSVNTLDKMCDTREAFIFQRFFCFWKLK